MYKFDGQATTPPPPPKKKKKKDFYHTELDKPFSLK